MNVQVAIVKAYRKAGGAIATVIRGDRTRRYRVSLRRYHALREWTNVGCPWRTSGAWMRNSLTAYLWADPTKEAHAQ